MGGEEAMATLTVGKSEALAIQEVSIVDKHFRVLIRTTLTSMQDAVTENLAPGRYLVTGMAPSGRRVERPVTLADGDALRIDLDVAEPSPHEWLHDVNARQELPSSDLKSLYDRADHDFPFVELLRAGPRPSINFALNMLAEPLSEMVIYPFGYYRGRQRSQVDLRSYRWSTKRLRWVRSSLVEQAEMQGIGSGDYLRLNFPGREVDDQTLHMVGLFREGRPATMFSLPQFARGTRLVVSGVLEDDGADVTAASRVTWRLSANEDKIDALLQSLGGRQYRDTEAVAEMAIDEGMRILRDKMRDPEAAVVAGFFLLNHRRLDQRADWVENLASWFPWLPDALVLGAWSNLLFKTGDSGTALKKLAKVYRAGPPQLAVTRRYLRDLLSTALSGDELAAVSTNTRRALQRLWSRLGRESRREIAGGPFYTFERR